MKLHATAILLLLVSGCLSLDSSAPIYGDLKGGDFGHARFTNTASGDRFFKDRFMVSAVDTRDVVLSEKAEAFDVLVHSGRHELLLAYVGHRPQVPPNRVRAEVHIAFEVEAGKRYRIVGVIEGKVARMWIEDVVSSAHLTEDLSAAFGDYPEKFDPLGIYPTVPKR